MPKIVNHDERRRQIVRGYLEVAARDGIGSTSSRALAAHLGVAAGSLWHFFPNFDAVVAAAYEQIFHDTSHRIAERTNGRRGLSALEKMLREVLPLTAQTILEAGVVVSFWGLLPGRPELRTTHVRFTRAWRNLIATHLRQAVRDEELAGDAPVKELADHLILVSTSLQLERIVESDLGGARRQFALCWSLLAPWSLRSPTGRTPHRAGTTEG